MKHLPLAVFAVLMAFTPAARPQALTPALEDVRRSLVQLDRWSFQPDPAERGLELGWARPSFDDSKWPVLKADGSWQRQGFPDHHGVGWYRTRVEIPAAWKGSKILLQSDGVRDEYEIYLNGRRLRHFGSRQIPTQGVPTQIDLAGFLKYGAANTLAIKVTEHRKDWGGIDRRMILRRVPDMAPSRALLPSPVLPARPELVKMYWHTWDMAWEKISFGTAANGMVPAYMDEGYNEQIYQWDSIFISMYGRYGRRLFPAMPTLDNFYRKQRPDGYIQRIYSETNGRVMLEPGTDYTVTNPPLFAWAEWDYMRLSGDDSRLKRVLPVLEKYDAWIVAHQSSALVPGMLWQTPFDSGMDNMPRPNAKLAGWVDTTLQQVLVAKYLALIAGHVGDSAKAEHWRAEARRRAADVNRLAWNAADGFYYDVDRDGRHTGVKHIGALWALLADVADPVQAAQLIGHLKNPDEFYRPHLFPALAASDSSFTPQASYWAGGVWAPTNYMTIRGLVNYGQRDFAHEAALNHLERMAAVHASRIDEKHVDPNEADGDYGTIWECYNPDRAIPCTRADAFYYGRQDFAGWTGLGPVALLIEQVIGLEIVGAENRVTWSLREPGRVGLQRFDVGPDNLVDLIAAPVDGARTRSVLARAQKPFTLVIVRGKDELRLAVPAGESRFQIPAPK